MTRMPAAGTGGKSTSCPILPAAPRAEPSAGQEPRRLVRPDLELELYMEANKRLASPSGARRRR